MLRMQRLAPSIRTTLGCQPSILSRKSPFSTTRGLSNQGIPPQIPPQYFPQQPLPQYFPRQPEEPSSTGSKYFQTILIFLLGVFVGHHFGRDPYTGKLTFIAIPPSWLSGLGMTEFSVRRKRIEKWSEDHGLGKIKGMPTLPGEKLDPEDQNKMVYPENIQAMRAEQERNPSPKLENELAIHDMMNIIVRLVQFGDLQSRPWGFGFWHATNGDYSKFAGVTPLVQVYNDGQGLIHNDTLKLLGNENYFAFAVARRLANVVAFHDAELTTTNLITYVVPAVIYFVTRKQPTAKWVSKVISSHLVLSLGETWLRRRAELANDEIALMMLLAGGFDLEAIIPGIKKISELENTPSSSLPEWLQSKPSMASRIKNLEELLPDAIAQQEELKKTLEIFEKLAAQQQDGQQFGGSDKFPSPDDEKDDEEESKSG